MIRPATDRVARYSGLLGACERRMRASTTVLMYHRVLEDEDCADYPFPSLVMPRSLFEAQVDYLSERTRGREREPSDAGPGDPQGHDPGEQQHLARGRQPDSRARRIHEGTGTVSSNSRTSRSASAPAVPFRGAGTTRWANTGTARRFTSSGTQ